MKFHKVFWKCVFIVQLFYSSISWQKLYQDIVKFRMIFPAYLIGLFGCNLLELSSAKQSRKIAAVNLMHPL